MVFLSFKGPGAQLVHQAWGGTWRNVCAGSTTMMNNTDFCLSKPLWEMLINSDRILRIFGVLVPEIHTDVDRNCVIGHRHWLMNCIIVLDKQIQIGDKYTALMHRAKLWQGHSYVLPVSHFPGHVFAYLLPTEGRVWRESSVSRGMGTQPLPWVYQTSFKVQPCFSVHTSKCGQCLIWALEDEQPKGMEK